MKRAVLIIGAALLWPAMAQAELNYNYAQVGYAVGDIDTDTIVREFVQKEIEESYSGYTLEASGTFMDYFLLQGEYTNFSLEGNEGDLVMGRAGLGGYLALSDSMDVYGTVNYEEYKTYYADGNGAGATLGLRWQASELTEVSPFIGYADYGEVESDDGYVQGDLSGWRAGVRATFKLTENFAISTDWRTSRLSLEQNDEGVDDADIELNEELWFSLRYYWK